MLVKEIPSGAILYFGRIPLGLTRRFGRTSSHLPFFFDECEVKEVMGKCSLRYVLLPQDFTEEQLAWIKLSTFAFSAYLLNRKESK